MRVGGKKMGYTLNPFTGKFDYYTGWKPKAAVVYDLDFSASTSQSVTILLDDEVQQLLRGRLYIDADPGSGFAAWGTISLHNKTAKHSHDVFYRTSSKLVYTEMEVASTGSDANLILDDETDLSPNDLVRFLDDDEQVRLTTIADTCVAEDTVGTHAIDVGVSRVVELHDVLLWNAEGDKEVYLDLDFIASQTVSLKLELILMERK